MTVVRKPRRKFTPEEHADIRRRYEAADEGVQEIADSYGVPSGTISNIALSMGAWPRRVTGVTRILQRRRRQEKQGETGQ
jgi:transposase-like protein